ncbi:hypothetical protein AcV7_005311 [Taiwanofungus camphoratus]|nr:hypothetical protein AcV7_005311 [Antrodia cinnamomea]
MYPDITNGILQHLLEGINKTRYSQLASSVIILYDHLLTLDQEYKLIWENVSSYLIDTTRSLQFCEDKCPLTLKSFDVRILGDSFNNYALFSPMITDSLYVNQSYYCLNWYRWQGWTGVIAFVIAELILQLRLYALYLLDRRVLVFTAMNCLVAAAASTVVMGSVLAKISATVQILPNRTFCMLTGVSSYFYAFWIPMLVSESVLCGLAMYCGFQNYRSEPTLFQAGKRLVVVLIRDSVFYFVVMFATYLTNAIVFIVGKPNDMEIPIGFAVALPCVMGNRLCLNVRGMIRSERTESLSKMATPQVNVASEQQFTALSESLLKDIESGSGDLMP